MLPSAFPSEQVEPRPCAQCHQAHIPQSLLPSIASGERSSSYDRDKSGGSELALSFSQHHNERWQWLISGINRGEDVGQDQPF